MADRVKLQVATCRDGAEAALIRALLDGHGIHAHVAGEHHASMLGGLAGPLIPLHVWVDAEDAEPAAELIRSMRDDEFVPDEDDQLDALDAELDGELEDAVDPRRAIEQRKRTGIVLLLSCVVTFGTGHLYVGAWPRAFALAGLEAYGFYRLADAPTLGVAMIAGAVVLDVVGAMLHVRRDPPLPRARLVA